MKRGAFGVMMLVVSLSFIASVANSEEVPITEKNIAQLVGEWKGTREVIRPRPEPVLDTDLTISSPQKASIKYYGGMYGGDSFSVDVTIKDGKILLKCPEIDAALALSISSGKMRLEGSFAYVRSTTSFVGRYTFYKKIK